MAKIKSPCLDCDDRVVGCHSSCEKYAAYRAEIDTDKSVITEVKTKENLIYSYKVESIKRMKRGKKKR